MLITESKQKHQIKIRKTLDKIRCKNKINVSLVLVINDYNCSLRILLRVYKNFTFLIDSDYKIKQ